MHQTPAVGNLRAKTGTINYVSALSGYVRAANGEWIAFAIISNDVPSTWRAKRVEDAIGVRLARFTRPLPTQRLAAGGATSPGVATQGAAVPGAPAPGGAAAGNAAGNATAVAQPASPTVDSARVHVIEKGDVLERIAKRYGTTVDAILNANPGVDPRRLIPGRQLQIP